MTTNLPQILKLENGTRVEGTFSEREMRSRLDRLRAVMAERGIDAALFTSYHNVNYYSDFLYCSFGRNYGLVVTPESSTSISANIDGGRPWRRTFGDNIVYTDWHRDNFFVAVKTLISDGMRVGIEYDHISVENLRKLQGVLPSSELVDVGKPAMRLRIIKSAEEIALIRECAQIADIGAGAAIDSIAVGVPEHEVTLRCTEVMVREIAQRFPHAELMDTWAWLQSGVNTDGAHNPVTSRRIMRGDILILNCFPMLAGYYTALERTLFAEECSDEQLRLWQINIKVHEAGIRLIKPGVRCCDIANELNGIYNEYGLLKYRTFGYGHSFGVLSHYYGREGELELREDMVRQLEPGMVVSMEPMIMVPQGHPGAGGYREHDILVVTEDGAENITAFPYGPDHNIIVKTGDHAQSRSSLQRNSAQFDNASLIRKPERTTGVARNASDSP